MKKILLPLLILLAACGQPGKPTTTRQDPMQVVLDNTVALKTPAGDVYCSGVVTGGVVLTAAHCVESRPLLILVELQGETFPVVLKTIDSEQDLAVLAATDRKLGEGVPVFAYELRYGEVVTVVGYPLGEFGKHLTRGVVSNPQVVGGLTDEQRVFYHDAATQPGNSGGPVVNLRGELIGITSYGIIKGAVCVLGCPGVYQDTTLNGAVHVESIRSLLGDGKR